MSHRIVVVGGGAGGLELATRLGRKLGRSGKAEITLVDAQMTHVWKPLLHEVAAGALSVPDNELNFLAQAKWNHFNFQLGRLCGIDRAQREIRLAPLRGSGVPLLAPTFPPLPVTKHITFPELSSPIVTALFLRWAKAVWAKSIARRT